MNTSEQTTLRDRVPLFVSSLNAIHPSWQPCFSQKEVAKALIQCHAYYQEEIKEHKTVYPPAHCIFAALTMPVESVRCVILGQDPYHGVNQANGLAFSVHQDVDIPPSLRNIYKEIQEDIGCPVPAHGDLSTWVAQGVLLLNTGLTVAQAQAASHQHWPWPEVTDAIIRYVNENASVCTFLLWGRHAQNKQNLIDAGKHRLLIAPHPSPLSAHRGFLGCRHFSQVNQFLAEKGVEQIDWCLS